MMLEKIKYIQSEKDNELSYLNKELSSVQQKCSLLEMSVEDHQAENTRLKRELSEIEMAHKLEREKVKLEFDNASQNRFIFHPGYYSFGKGWGVYKILEILILFSTG